MEANYIYNSSGAISVKVNEGYWDQTVAGTTASEKEASTIKLPNVVFFGPL